MTEPELAILKLLWRAQPQSARDLHEALTAQFAWGYSSTRKTLERMCEKGLLIATADGNKNYYRTELDKVATLAKTAQTFFKQVLEMDGPLPVALFSDSKLLSEADLAQMEALVVELSKEPRRD